MTISEFHSALKNKKTSVRESVSGYLDNIKKKNKEVNSYLEVWEEETFSRAAEVDKRIAEGEEPGELCGVPLAIKDNILIEGKIASAASKILGNYRASYDAHVVSKLKKAGVIFLGRTNMDEFAMGSSTENSAYGATKNPRDISKVPGGSSGGSAAAVAGGLAMAALGSDTGGSIRQPAAFCGVVGLKPTYGAVSRSGLIAMASSLDQIGPLAQTVEDAELLFNVIKGKDPLDSTSVEIRNSKFEIRNKSKIQNYKLKIGIPKEFFGEGLNKEIKKEIDGVIKKLEKEHEIKEISLPNSKYAVAVYYILMPAEISANLARYDGIRYGKRSAGEDIMEVYKKSRGEGLGMEVKRRILLGTYALSAGYYDAYYAKAQKVRALIKKDFDSAFKEVDVILGPTTPTPPFKLGEKIDDPLAMYLSDIYTIPANLAGIPALTLGNGAQLMAPHFGEPALFELGKQLEKIMLT